MGLYRSIGTLYVGLDRCDCFEGNFFELIINCSIFFELSKAVRIFSVTDELIKRRRRRAVDGMYGRTDAKDRVFIKS